MAVPLALTSRNYNPQIYSDFISSVWAFWDIITDPGYALRQELDIWEILQRDPKCYQGIQQRLNAVAGPNWRCFPWNNSRKKSEKIKAAVVEALLRRIPHFHDARKRLAQAVFRGQTSELILGRREWVSLADYPMQEWWVPTGLKNIDPRRFAVRPERTAGPDGRMRVRGRLHISVIPTYSRPPEGRELYYGRYVPVEHPEWLVRVVYDDEESRLGFGRGIMDVLYFYNWAKQLVFREGLQGLERWSQGIVVGKIDPDRRGATDQSSETIRNDMKAQLEKMKARAVFVADKGDDIQVLTGGMEGHQIVLGLLGYLDSSIIAVATGATLRSAGDVGSVGSFASDKVGQEIQENIVQFDIGKLDEDISLDLIGLIDRLNRSQFEALGARLGVPGLADAHPPQFRTVHKRQADPVAAASKFSALAAMGKPVRIRKDEFYEELGNTPPDDEDDVIELGGPQAQAYPGAFPPNGAGAEEVFPEDDESLFEEGAETGTLPTEGGAAEGVQEEEPPVGSEPSGPEPAGVAAKTSTETPPNKGESYIAGRIPPGGTVTEIDGRVQRGDGGAIEAPGKPRRAR